MIEILSSRVKKSFIELLEGYVKENVTIRNTEIKIKERIQKLSAENKKSFRKQLVKAAQTKLIKSLLSALSSDELSDIKICCDQLLLQGLVTFVEKVEEESTFLFQFEKLSEFQTCANHFGSPNGCQYGESCKFSHKCSPERRQGVILDSVNILMKSKHGLLNALKKGKQRTLIDPDTDKLDVKITHIIMARYDIYSL